jgi:antitoxin ParD1/3/4
MEEVNVNLTPELERLVQEKVASGLYNNQSEVVREALRLLAEQDRIREAHLVRLREALAQGLAEASRGDLLPGDAVVEEMRGLVASRSKSTKDR